MPKPWTHKWSWSSYQEGYEGRESLRGTLHYHIEGVEITILGIHGHTTTILGTHGRTTIAIIILGVKLGEASAKLYLKFFTHDIIVKLLREEGEPRKIHTRIRSFDGDLIRIRYLPANLGLHQNITDDEKRVPQRFI